MKSERHNENYFSLLIDEMQRINWWRRKNGSHLNLSVRNNAAKQIIEKNKFSSSLYIYCDINRHTSEMKELNVALLSGTNIGNTEGGKLKKIYHKTFQWPSCMKNWR